MQVHILDDWSDTLRTLACFQLLDGHEVTVWTDHVLDENELFERLADAEALVLFRERTPVTRELIERLPRLRLISQRGAVPHVDVAACSDHGVLLCSDRGADRPSYAAAELTFALILSAMRQIPQHVQSLKNGTWQVGVGKTLRGRILGLYGYGRIARAVSDYARAFGMHVWWWGSETGRQRASEANEPIASSRTAFFAESDVVSLHVRLKPTTRGIVSAADLALMTPQSLLVNTARAGLIEEGALLGALEKGRPGMAAIDVFDTEPLTEPNDPLVSHPRLLATPHIGYVTEDEFALQFRDVFAQINAFESGSPINMINAEVWRR